MLHPHGSDEFLRSTRGQVAESLRPGPATVSDLAAHLGLTDNAVRSHLQILMRDGLVRAAGVRRTEGAGKPATWYELTPDTDLLFSRAYLPVLEALLDALDDQLGPKAHATLTRHAARALAERFENVSADGAGPEEIATRVIEGLGGRVEVSKDTGQVTLQGQGCPLSLLTRRHPDLCTLVAQVLSDVAGREVREECDRGDRPRCRFALPAARPGHP